MNTNQAIGMIRDHGLKAFATADGLLAVTDYTFVGVEAYEDGAYADNDFIFEESTVFEVREDGTIDSVAIRRWLGY